MSESAYNHEVQVVKLAIDLLRTEVDSSLINELEEEQRAARTGLEWYGITKSVFERFLSSRQISNETRAALTEGVHAVRVIYGSVET